MSRQSVVAALAGTVVLVVWGMVFWALLAPALSVFHKIPNDAAVTQVLLSGQVATGTYFMPWPRDTPEAFDRFVAQHKSGPFYRLSYVREGVDPNSPAKLLLGTLHYLSVAILAVALVSVMAERSFGRRATAVFLAGLLGTNFITLGDPVWFHMPWDYTLGVLLFEVVAWLLLALTVARLGPGR